MRDTIKVIRILLLMVIQHGGDNVSCKRSIRHDIAVNQRHNSQSLLSSSTVKNRFHLVVVLSYTGYEFYESN